MALQPVQEVAFDNVDDITHVICPHISSLLGFNRSYWLCNGSLSQICTESETLVALSATFLPLFQRPGLLFQFSHRKNQARARSGVNHTIHGLFGNWVFPELNSFKIIQNKDGEQAIYDKLKAMSRIDLAL